MDMTKSSSPFYLGVVLFCIFSLPLLVIYKPVASIAQEWTATPVEDRQLASAVSGQEKGSCEKQKGLRSICVSKSNGAPECLKDQELAYRSCRDAQ